jgi:division protein CdvB (Snf7/Vps24/ESCRT-III family)
MNDVLNELDFMLKIKAKFEAVEKEIGEVYDIIIERALAKQAEIKKFEKAYEAKTLTDEEIKSMVGEINGI